jgi:NADH dehydrogenase FAD-containing subunit
MTVSDSNDLFETALIPYDKLFANPNGTFVQGVVETIRPEKKGGSVILADGQELAYDILVLAPGASWEGPLDFPGDADAVKAFVTESRSRFKKAQKIVLVGGGAVGVGKCLNCKILYQLLIRLKKNMPEKSRTSGRYVYTFTAIPSNSISSFSQDKEVTIVHGDSILLNSTYPARYRNGLQKSIRARGVNIVLDDFVDEIPAPGPASIKTRKGVVIEADLVVRQFS